jgi:hypothetical protein
MVQNDKKTFGNGLTPSGEKMPSNPADLRPVVLRLVSDPLTAGRLEKLRIALLRQISRYGWRLMMTALEAACEHGARHQQANPQAVALWRWRAQMLGQLAMQEQAEPAPNAASPRRNKKGVTR